MRRLALVLALGCAAFGGLVAAAQPVAADDCSTLVKGIGDLNNPSTVQDCLRTGSNWGRVLGTVVAATGVTVAAVGLAKPPRPSTTTRTQKGPCAEAALAGAEVHRLAFQKAALERRIVADWQRYALRAQQLAGEYRRLKEMEGLTLDIQQLVITRNAAAVAFALFSMGKALAAYGATTAAAATAEAALPMAGVVSTEAVQTYLAAQAARAAAARALAYEGIKGIGGYIALGLSDPVAADETRAMMRQLVAQGTAYYREATAFNRAFSAWGGDRQTELNQACADINAAEHQRVQALRNCVGPDTAVPDPEPCVATTIHVLQVPTTFGSRWILAGIL